jgi:hypothetical protein
MATVPASERCNAIGEFVVDEPDSLCQHVDSAHSNKSKKWNFVKSSCLNFMCIVMAKTNVHNVNVVVLTTLI